MGYNYEEPWRPLGRQKKEGWEMGCDKCFYFKIFIAHLGRKFALVRNIRYNCAKELFGDEVEQIQHWVKVCNHFFTL